MLIRKLKDCNEITAGDGTALRELIHPDRNYKFSGNYSLAYAVLPPGRASLRHKLKSNEVYYIMAGQGEIYINNEKAVVEPGDTIDIPPESIQWIKNISASDLTFLCIVDPAWNAAEEEILE